METYFRISTNKNTQTQNEIIIISPETVPSDVPYLVKLENNDDSKFEIIKLEYIPKEEKLARLKPNDEFEIQFGEKTGKIYEFKYKKDLNNRQLKEILSNFKKSQFKNTVSFRFINNIKSTVDIVTDAIKLNKINNSAVHL